MLDTHWRYKKVHSLTSNFNFYEFPMTIDSILASSIKGDSIWIKHPALPYYVEDAVRSVKHARLYWEEGIYFRHLFHLRYYLLLVALVLLGLPLLRLKNLVIIVLLIAVLGITTEAAEFYDQEQTNLTIYWDTIQYLILPALALGGLGISVMKKKYNPSALFFFTLAIINLLIPLAVIGYGPYSDKVGFGYPYYPSNFAFYGLQALALVAALLMPYVRALPKVD